MRAGTIVSLENLCEGIIAVTAELPSTKQTDQLIRAAVILKQELELEQASDPIQKP